MLLIGRDLSPFVRRTATVIEVLGLEYKRCKLATADAPEEVAKFNPLARVPALVLSNDEILFDSNAIIDYLLEIGDTGHTLLPPNGSLRRNVLRVSAISTGVMEKGVAAAYEMRRRPEHLIYEPWLLRIKAQVRDGLAFLERNIAEKIWFTGPELGLDDINAVVAFDYIAQVHPDLISPGFPGLVALSSRANALLAFRHTQWKPG
jgi:glutathione S-transferase